MNRHEAQHLVETYCIDVPPDIDRAVARLQAFDLDDFDRVQLAAPGARVQQELLDDVIYTDNPVGFVVLGRYCGQENVILAHGATREAAAGMLEGDTVDLPVHSATSLLIAMLDSDCCPEIVTGDKDGTVVYPAWTYSQRAEAHFGDTGRTVVIPDEIDEDQRLHDRQQTVFPALAVYGDRIDVRLEGAAYDLHGPGTGDTVVVPAEGGVI